MPASGKSGNVLAKYLPVYFVLLAISAIEFFLAYQNFSKAGLVRILLVLAIGSAALGLMYFMHLAHEKRSRSEEHTSELQSHSDLVCRLLLEKKKKNTYDTSTIAS